MAKDDYFVVAYKILAYLYVQLKAGESIDSAMLAANGPLMKINERYWTYILENLQAQGYIRNVHMGFMGGQKIITDYEQCEITPEGIAYLCDNSLMEKAKQFLKDVKEITPFI
ncbi:MAG: YjcQ family protein [Clostridiales bacterium]|nr:YjcQ family protein [Clostridiales bacterium]MCD8368264.1 YjcQ family protein [Clostridiales bacterium]